MRFRIMGESVSSLHLGSMCQEFRSDCVELRYADSTLCLAFIRLLNHDSEVEPVLYSKAFVTAELFHAHDPMKADGLSWAFDWTAVFDSDHTHRVRTCLQIRPARSAEPLWLDPSFSDPDMSGRVRTLAGQYRDTMLSLTAHRRVLQGAPSPMVQLIEITQDAIIRGEKTAIKILEAIEAYKRKREREGST